MKEFKPLSLIVLTSLSTAARFPRSELPPIISNIPGTIANGEHRSIHSRGIRFRRAKSQSDQRHGHRLVVFRRRGTRWKECACDRV